MKKRRVQWISILTAALMAVCTCAAVPVQAEEILPDEMLVEEMPVEEIPVEEIPVEGMPVEEMPVVNVQAEGEMSVQVETPSCTVLLLKTDGGTLYYSPDMTLPEAMETGSPEITDLRVFRAGETVFLTAVPDAGFETEAVYVVSENGETWTPEQTDNGFSFTLPEGTVQAYAVFRAVQEPEVTPEAVGEVPGTKEMPEETAADPAEESAHAAAKVQAVPETDEKPAENTAAADKEENVSEEDAADAEEDETLLQEGTPSVSYRTHVQNVGWQDYVQDSALAGTTGRSLRLEGINIKLSGVKNSGIKYRTHVQNIGWQDWVADDAMAGTSGKSLRLEAIQIELTGDAANDYDVYYCVHVQNYGWLNWAKNGEIAGTAGYGMRLEGIRVKLQKKGTAAPAAQGTRSVAALYGSVQYSTHVQNIGWTGYVGDGSIGGTTGQGLRMEAIRIRFNNPSLTGFVQYRAHVQDIGWENMWHGTDKVCGTEGQSKRLEAIQIKLYGAIESEYDIWYRTHVQNYGWTGWTNNGEPCGSEGIGYRMEAVQIKLLPKGSPAPGATGSTLFTQRYEDAVGGALMVKARNYVNSITNAAMTNETKLRVCFDSFRTKVEKLVWFPVYTGADWPQVYANYFFDHDYGDCLCFNSAFAYMAKAIGYDNVYALNSTGHGWAEINGLIYDPEYSLHASDLYGTPYSARPDYQAVRDLAGPGNTYRMKI